MLELNFYYYKYNSYKQNYKCYSSYCSLKFYL
jgi:hypothetical protein